MIELFQDKDGYVVALLKGDSHQAVWVKEHRSLVTDQTVPVRLLPLIQEGDTVCDIGSNIGTHAFSYGKKVGPTGKVFAFEPNLPAFVALAVNVRDMDWVKCFHAALGHAPKVCGLSIPKDAHSEGRVNYGMARMDNGTESGVWFDLVQVYTLDSLNLSRCNFIKIDVEGWEPYVLNGALETIKKHRPIMFIEINKSALAHFGFDSNDILGLMDGLNYRIDGDPDLNAPQVDILFMPK